MPPLKLQLTQAAAHLREGRTDRARELFEQILTRHPANPQALAELARIYFARSAFHPARKLLTRLVDSQPSNAEAHFSLATAHFLLHEPDPALTALAATISLNPDHAPAFTARAQIYLAKRMWDEAATAASRALEITPTAGPAAAILARCTRRAGDPAAARDQLVALLPNLTNPPDRIPCLFQLAHAHNDLADYDPAFDHFEQAQALQAELPETKSLDLDYPSRLIKDTLALCTPARIAGWASRAKPIDGLQPVFLVGFPRSGTTLTEQIIAAHPDAITTDEHPALSQVVSRIPQVTGSTAPYPQNIADIPDAAASILRADYRKSILAHLPESAASARIIVDKLPLNLLNIALIARLFPKAPILVALRDSRAVILSCMMQEWRPNPAMANLMGLERAAKFYAQAMDLWFHLKPLLANPTLEFHYEDTVADLPAQARRILSFLDLPWDPSVLEFHKRATEKFISTPSAEAVSKPIQTAPAERWKHYEHRLAPALPHLERCIEIFAARDAPPE